MLPCELVVNWLRLILIDVYCILYVYDVPSFHSTKVFFISVPSRTAGIIEWHGHVKNIESKIIIPLGWLPSLYPACNAYCRPPRSCPCHGTQGSDQTATVLSTMVWVGHANVQFGCPARHLLQASFHGIRNLHVLTPSTLSNIVATRFKRTGVAFNCGEICLLRHNLSQLLQTRQALTNTWQRFAIVSGRHLFRECTARQRVKHLIFFAKLLHVCFLSFSML